MEFNDGSRDMRASDVYIHGGIASVRFCSINWSTPVNEFNNHFRVQFAPFDLRESRPRSLKSFPRISTEVAEEKNIVSRF